MTPETFWTAVGTVVATVGIVYTFLRNFRKDINENFKEIKDDIKEMKTDIKLLTSRIDRLEVPVEERTLRVIYPKTGSEEQK